jgi:hypothetical protein
MTSMITLAVSATVLAMLLIAVMLPWLTVNLRGQYSFALTDVIRGLTSREAVDPSEYRNGNFASFTTTYKDIYLAFVFSIIFYASAIIYLIGSVASANKRKAALGPGGILAIAGTVAWIFGIEILKTHVLDDAKSAGPFADLSSGFINSVFSAGSGPYVILAGGIIALAYYFMKEVTWKRASHEIKEEELISEEGDEESDVPVESEMDESSILEKEVKKTVRKPTNINIIVYKSTGTAALLAFIGAIFGLPGIGHIYVGRVGRGLLILFSGFVLYIFSWLSFLTGAIGGILGGPNAGIPFFQTGTSLAIALFLMYFGLLVWQILDARSQAKKLNEQIQLTGKEPW